MKLEKRNWIEGLLITLLILLIIFMLGKVSTFFVGFFSITKKVLTPFLLGLIIAYLLNPVVGFLSRHHFPRSVAIILIYTIFFLFIAFVIINFGPVFSRQFRELSEKIPGLMEMYQNWMARVRLKQAAQPYSLHSGVAQTMRTMEIAVKGYVDGLFTGMQGLLDKLLLIAIVPFVVFYLLKDMKPFQRGFLLMIPRSHRLKVTRILHEVNLALEQYVRGQLTVCGVIAVIVYLAYFFIRLPYAVVFATLVAVTNIIPYIGPFIGAVPALLFALTISWKTAVYVAGINVVVQILEGNVFSPLIVGRSLHLHPLLIIFAVMVGGEIAGIPGLILAVPVVAAGKVILQHVWPRYRRRPDVPD
ncbi:AI-2E family transporter [Aneurinibacillus terranovensis]|uniref:AI-2E family transporter n=1 Tax=Aneurinibacillus terranovensis TaxID=278991 RepID=UPI00040830EF|nr:AI-2E family transporter [Aneurinibacillus terranovensis]